MLDASAYFGELIRSKLGGKWNWNGNFSDCIIEQIRG